MIRYVRLFEYIAYGNAENRKCRCTGTYVLRPRMCKAFKLSIKPKRSNIRGCPHSHVVQRLLLRDTQSNSVAPVLSGDRMVHSEKSLSVPTSFPLYSSIYTYNCISPSLSLSLPPFLSLSVCLSIRLSVTSVSVVLSLYLSVFVFPSPFLWLSTSFCPRFSLIVLVSLDRPVFCWQRYYNWALIPWLRLSVHAKHLWRW